MCGWPQSAALVPSARACRCSSARTRLHAGFAARRGRQRASRRLGRPHQAGTSPSARSAETPRGSLCRHPGRPASWCWSALMSGALAGLAGASEVTGLKGYLTQDLSPGFGYGGIVVAMLALARIHWASCWLRCSSPACSSARTAWAVRGRVRLYRRPRGRTVPAYMLLGGALPPASVPAGPDARRARYPVSASFWAQPCVSPRR